MPASGRARFGELHIFGLGFGTEFPEKYGPTGTEDSNGSDQGTRKYNQ